MQEKIVFMGSPAFAVPILNALVKCCEVSGIVTQPDRPAGRGKEVHMSAVKARALELGLDTYEPIRLAGPEALARVACWKPDVVIVAAYGQILKPEMLQLPAHGCINVHASLLPRWRGASPIQAAILAGENATGVSVMKMDQGLDTGPVYAQASLEIMRDDDFRILSLKLSSLGAELLASALPRIIGGELKAVPQDAEKATYCKLLRKEQGELIFSKDAEFLERQIRAFSVWPGSFFHLDGRLIKVLKAQVSEPSTAPSGTRCIINGHPAISTAKGDLVLETVQPAGKKIMSGKQFLQGYRSW